MVSLPKPQVIFTHESDLDGLVSGVLLQRLAKKLFSEDVRLEAHHYHTWRLRDLRESAAWVTDLSFEARLDRSNWTVVDHHATDCVPKKACDRTGWLMMPWPSVMKSRPLMQIT